MHLERLVWNMMDLGVRYLGLAPHMVWGPPELPKADSEALLLDILDAGVFGSSTMERKHSSLITIRAASDGRGREGTLGSAIFPPAASLAGRYPYLRKWPCLLPVAWCARGLGYLKEGRNVGGPGRRRCPVWPPAAGAAGAVRSAGPQAISPSFLKSSPEPPITHEAR